MGGLWQFPGGKIKEKESPVSACVRKYKVELNLYVNVQKHLVQVKHAYTHFKVVVEVFLCNQPSAEIILNGPVDYRWVNFSELSRYPIPSANHKIIKYLGQIKLREQ